MTEEEMKEALDLALDQNTKLAQMVIELIQKLNEATALIESMRKDLAERGVK